MTIVFLMTRPLLVIVVAYLLGSIPFGYLIVRLRKRTDVRGAGSGGTGATNVSRQAGKAFGVLTLVLDALKGAVAVLFAAWILNAGMSSAEAAWWIAGAAIAVVVGHCFPIWLGFRGGKGVATGLGVFLVLAPIAVGLAVAGFVAIVLLTRYVSLGSIVAAATIPMFVWVQHVWIRPFPNPAPWLLAAIAGAALIVFAHRANIGRLLQGTENRFK